MAMAIPIIMVAAAAMQAVGSIQAGNAKAASLRSQAAADEFNAEVARQKAATAYEQGSNREELQRRQDRATMGRQAAGFSGANIVGTSGSAAIATEESAVNAELNSLNILYESQLSAKGLLEQANLDEASAAQNRKNARAARTSGYLGAGASSLNAVASYSAGAAKSSSYSGST